MPVAKAPEPLERRLGDLAAVDALGVRSLRRKPPLGLRGGEGDGRGRPRGREDTCIGHPSTESCGFQFQGGGGNWAKKARAAHRPLSLLVFCERQCVQADAVTIDAGLGRVLEPDCAKDSLLRAVVGNTAADQRRGRVRAAGRARGVWMGESVRERRASWPLVPGRSSLMQNAVRESASKVTVAGGCGPPLGG